MSLLFTLLPLLFGKIKFVLSHILILKRIGLLPDWIFIVSLKDLGASFTILLIESYFLTRKARSWAACTWMKWVCFESSKITKARIMLCKLLYVLPFILKNTFHQTELFQAKGLDKRITARWGRNIWVYHGSGLSLILLLTFL